MIWIEKAFEALSARELYGVLALRQQVFGVEQNCAYLDADGKDAHAVHLYCANDEGVAPDGGGVLAYARLFAPGGYYDDAAIGRVVTHASQRRTGLGRELMRRSIASVEARWGRAPIRIGAQKYLLRFYESFGFVSEGIDYVEDGIDHVFMTRA